MHNKEQLLKRGMNEADEIAWDDRRHALKMILQEHEDKMNEIFFLEEGENEDNTYVRVPDDSK